MCLTWVSGLAFVNSVSHTRCSASKCTVHSAVLVVIHKECKQWSFKGAIVLVLPCVCNF